MAAGEDRDYRPIGDYALIGDAHTAALVSTDGSVDWCCWPHFDSAAVFCRLLDRRRGGYFQICPRGRFDSTRAYVEGTNVLTTTFEAEGGRVRLTDSMPVERLTESHVGEDIASSHRILRLVEGLGGEVEMSLALLPTFDYARVRADYATCEGGVIARAPGKALALSSPVELRRDATGALVARFRVRTGERLWFVLSYLDGDAASDHALPPCDVEEEARRTLAYWREWFETCAYRGPYPQHVQRSALVLKLLTFEPTGALVAAPTTSLPERVGGVRNWDYRYTWLRDSALIIYALQLLGYEEEAADFFDWLDNLSIPRGGDLQIMYTIKGEAELPERTLDHLEGYRGSRPVRVGNAAYRQKQLDIYGEVLDAAHLFHETRRRPIRPELWRVLRYMADETVARWREPDSGIWEVRGGPRHFLYSKLLCWTALDRAIRLAEREGLSCDREKWSREREEIRRAILTRGYDERLGAFTQSFDSTALDASALVISQLGFLPATDPRVRSTVARIRERLTSHGLVYRYLNEDGLPGDEATFALCSFWLVDNLARLGRVDEARELFERIVSYANDLGLLSEEIDPQSRELLGNYPQGFTHLGLIRSALNIAKAEAQGAETRPEDAAERERRTRRAEGEPPHAPDGD